MKKLFAALLLLGSVHLLTLQSQACTGVGAVTRETYYSAWLSQNMVYTVVTPPCYDATHTYPTVVLMHGSNDDDGHWVRLGLPELLDEGVQAGTLPPMIFVLPYGDNIANRNWFDDVSWSNVFLTELLPDVWAKYPAISRDPRQTALGGISRGGFWAYQIGLRHPELFGTLGGHSAFFDCCHADASDNPLDLVLSEPGVPTQTLWLDRGGSDYAAPGLTLMDAAMQQRGLRYQYTIYPTGEHNNDYWRAHVSDYLAFYASSLTQAPITEQITPTPAAINAFVTNTPLPDQTAVPQFTPVAFVSPTPNSVSAGYQLIVPVVAFPSIRTSLATEELNALIAGNSPIPLLAETDTVGTLATNGIVLVSAQILLAGEVEDALWDNYDAVALVPFDRLTPRMRVLWLNDQPVFDQLDTFVLAFRSTTPNFLPEKFGRVTMSGVTALTRRMIPGIDAVGVAEAASGIQEYVTRSDYFHTSNEVSFIEGCPSVPGATLLGGGGSFCSKPAHFEIFKLLDVDIVELTGNHNADYGYDAYDSTLGWFIANGIQTIGGGATVQDARTPLILNVKGTTIGWLACNVPGPYYAMANDTEGINNGVHGGAATCDMAWLREAIPALKAQVDYVIVTLQQLEVEDYLPLASQRVDFRTFIDLGADFVGGTAAHKPQVFEYYGTGFIHYGFGNVLFDQPFWGNMRFFMDTLLFYDGKLMSVELFPGIIDNQTRPRLMTHEERDNFLYFMLRRQNGF